LQRSYLNVLFDHYNPVLDMTVDGRYLIDGDFVSPNPSIKAQIWDENPYLLKTDTTGIRIFLTYPCQAVCQPKEIFLKRKDLVWHPATETSPFVIDFKPTNLPEGKYVLRIEVTDARGNLSGATFYEITFNVENESSVVISEAYPNPFKDVAFVNVVVTGQLPEHLEWRIMNINGQLQSQYAIEDFSSFHIGTNKLEWKGTDGNGNLLPGGVYIYTLTFNLQGTQVTKMGKLILLR